MGGRLVTGWLILYAAGLVYTARKLPVALLNHASILDADDPVDVVAARVLGVLISLVRPVIAFGALITGRLPKTDAQLRTELAARDRRIAELEHELGIPPASLTHR